MHEYSIVMSLVEQCENLAKEHQASAIARVAIKIGELSGVEPQLLATAFETFKQDTLCHSAVLEMQLQPLRVHCHDCGQDNNAKERNIKCPHCASLNTKVIDGEDMMLMQLEFETI